MTYHFKTGRNVTRRRKALYRVWQGWPGEWWAGRRMPNQLGWMGERAFDSWREAFDFAYERAACDQG